MFVDEVRIYVKAGEGGRGCVSFRREKFVPLGGPDGGDGGDGGNVILEADKDISTLLDLTYHRYNMAPKGKHGRGKKQHGARGKDLIIRVPAGTVVKDEDSGSILADLVSNGQQCVVARGGRGGRGNARFASATDRAPRYAQPGLPGEDRWLKLELKILADVGIVGFPNAGKSTLLSKISEAQTKAAPYPFTTLQPHLGVVAGPPFTTLVAADMPGLIEGAHKGHGLGTRFLRHIQRTRVILHVIDLNPETGRDQVGDWEAINREMVAFDPELGERPQVVAANKIDLPGSRERLDPLEEFCRKKQLPVYPVSALTGEGLDKLVSGVFKVLGELKDLDKQES